MKHSARLQALQKRAATASALAREIEQLDCCCALVDFNNLPTYLRLDVLKKGVDALLTQKEAEMEVLLDPFEEGLEQVHEQTKGIAS